MEHLPWVLPGVDAQKTLSQMIVLVIRMRWRVRRAGLASRIHGRY